MFLYFVFALPAMLLGMWAQYRVKSNYKKYAKVGTAYKLTGAQVARRLLDAQGLQNVQVEEVNGFLSDHYDPRSKVLRLSSDVYRTPSVAAAGIAAHEMGHALQDAQAYTPLKIRSAIVPGVQIGGWVGPMMFMVGLIFSIEPLAWLGLIFFSATAVFALVTLPVEFDASRRAKALLTSHNILMPDELHGVNKVLDAAALTYVAAAAQALSTVLYYGFLLSGNSRD